VFIQPLGTSKDKKQRMINLLQENIEIESQRTNSTFGFLPTHKKLTLKNQKSNFFLPTFKNSIFDFLIIGA
jgi:hypothetical protein